VAGEPNYSGRSVPPHTPDVECADVGGPVHIEWSVRHGRDADRGSDGWK
jgi:hypothetical protein